MSQLRCFWLRIFLCCCCFFLRFFFLLICVGEPNTVSLTTSITALISCLQHSCDRLDVPFAIIQAWNVDEIVATVLLEELASLLGNFVNRLDTVDGKTRRARLYRRR